eukprot:scaffold244_cov172-Amphora_coffeaeformis.AAC.1
MKPFLVSALLFCLGHAQALCSFPLTFTYFQKSNGYFCQSPNKYLESQYGSSFAVDTGGIAHETNDPNVRFIVKEVTDWSELQSRLAKLDPGVAYGSAHTPSLFWEGRQDVYWHANAFEDTISSDFKPAVDAYIHACLASTTPSATIPSFPLIPSLDTLQPTTMEDSGCSIGDSEQNSNDQVVQEGAESNVADINESVVCFVFFFSRGCPHCAKVKEFIEGNLKRDTDVKFRYDSYDVYKSDYSRRLIAGYRYFEWEGSQAVPTIFIGSESDMTVLVGDSTIIELLPKLLLELRSERTTCFDFGAVLEENPELADSRIHWGVLTAAALVDSINPCAIAVLLILLGGLTQSIVPHSPTTIKQDHPGQFPNPSSSSTPPADHSDEFGGKIEKDVICEGENEVESKLKTNDSGLDEEIAPNLSNHAPDEDAAPSSLDDSKSSRRRAFCSGMAFIFSVFLCYYALGFGIFFAVSSTKVSGKILLGLGVLIIFLGIWNIKDFFWYDVGYNVEIPRSWRPLLNRLLGAITSPVGAFCA